MTMTAIKEKLDAAFEKQTSILPLVIFRIAFGIMMAAGALRFWAKGWIDPLYIQPEFHFKYWLFEWVEPLPGNGMYFVFAALILLSLSIAAGFMYRISAVLYFLTFTYVELIDKALYLNHYYFISLISFLMIFMPANRFFSIDALLNKKIRTTHIPAIFPNLIKLQLAVVYIFAGIAKLNSEWLLEAMPLKLWLPARANLPVIGGFFDYEWVAYAMSWSGMLYDLTIPFFLYFSKTRKWAYATVVIFHFMTWYLFQIGMFPWIMIVSTLIFFEADDFKSLQRFLPVKEKIYLAHNFKMPVKLLIAVYLFLQLAVPFRHLIFDGSVSWNEQGFRYSWNVMRVEKTGHIEYRCVNSGTGREWTVYPAEHLTVIQAKQMAFQPDMILQYAHYLRRRYSGAEVYADAQVSLNGRPSRQLTDTKINLAAEEESLFSRYNWVINY